MEEDSLSRSIRGLIESLNPIKRKYTNIGSLSQIGTAIKVAVD